MNKSKLLFGLSVAGLLFAGYMSSVSMFSKTCAFGETCPDFLGYPACYYGFVMYLVLVLASGMFLFKKLPAEKAQLGIRIVSFLGILFAGYYTLGELPLLFSEGLDAYTMVLPTCAWGLVFYIMIFSATFIKSNQNE